MKAKATERGQLMTRDGEVSHFNEREFICRCGDCDHKEVSALLVDRLETLRARVGALVVSSGIRCRLHNSRVGGAPNSHHVPYQDPDDVGFIGHAADIHSRTLNPVRLFMEWRALFRDGGAGLYPGWIHVDVRPARVEWVSKRMDAENEGGPTAGMDSIATAAMQRLVE